MLMIQKHLELFDSSVTFIAAGGSNPTVWLVCIRGGSNPTSCGVWFNYDIVCLTLIAMLDILWLIGGDWLRKLLICMFAGKMMMKSLLIKSCLWRFTERLLSKSVLFLKKPFLEILKPFKTNSSWSWRYQQVKSYFRGNLFWDIGLRSGLTFQK